MFLNRLGAIRLLTAISKQCENLSLCENWEEVKRSHDAIPSKQKPRKFQQNSNLNRMSQYANPNIGREDNYYQRTPLVRRERPRITRQDTHPRALNRDNFHQNSNINFHTLTQARNVRGRGCFNCGELNHRESTCRFDHRLKCGDCGELGHKSKLCRHFIR